MTLEQLRDERRARFSPRKDGDASENAVPLSLPRKPMSGESASLPVSPHWQKLKPVAPTPVKSPRLANLAEMASPASKGSQGLGPKRRPPSPQGVPLSLLRKSPNAPNSAPAVPLSLLSRDGVRAANRVDRPVRAQRNLSPRFEGAAPNDSSPSGAESVGGVRITPPSSPTKPVDAMPRLCDGKWAAAASQPAGGELPATTASNPMGKGDGPSTPLKQPNGSAPMTPPVKTAPDSRDTSPLFRV